MGFLVIDCISAPETDNEHPANKANIVRGIRARTILTSLLTIEESKASITLLNETVTFPSIRDKTAIMSVNNTINRKNVLSFFGCFIDNL